jgi:hypothetical protein
MVMVKELVHEREMKCGQDGFATPFPSNRRRPISVISRIHGFDGPMKLTWIGSPPCLSGPVLPMSSAGVVQPAIVATTLPTAQAYADTRERRQRSQYGLQPRARAAVNVMGVHLVGGKFAHEGDQPIEVAGEGLRIWGAPEGIRNTHSPFADEEAHHLAQLKQVTLGR